MTLLEDGACPAMRRLADVPVAGPGGIGLDLIFEARLADEMLKHGLRHRRAADVAETYKNDANHPTNLSEGFPVKDTRRDGDGRQTTDHRPRKATRKRSPYPWSVVRGRRRKSRLIQAGSVSIL